MPIKEDVKSMVHDRIKAPQDADARVLRRMFNDLQIPVESKPTSFQYWQYFASPWACNIEDEERHLEITRYANMFKRYLSCKRQNLLPQVVFISRLIIDIYNLI